jgi:hypothetical protein
VLTVIDHGDVPPLVQRQLVAPVGGDAVLVEREDRPLELGAAAMAQSREDAAPRVVAVKEVGRQLHERLDRVAVFEVRLVERRGVDRLQIGTVSGVQPAVEAQTAVRRLRRVKISGLGQCGRIAPRHRHPHEFVVRRSGLRRRHRAKPLNRLASIHRFGWFVILTWSDRL